MCSAARLTKESTTTLLANREQVTRVFVGGPNCIWAADASGLRTAEIFLSDYRWCRRATITPGIFSTTTVMGKSPASFSPLAPDGMAIRLLLTEWSNTWALQGTPRSHSECPLLADCRPSMWGRVEERAT